ncbi:uncharacterized protein LOC106658379 [Trichogramma pretiosum]|uniref:uncharacterized protein LOC106658379 n=1 Tax=Trichogramma pretiosum TaxID=7493 RepID=UPI0006C999E0|nr:uncharacterized protein LOC106658379 [Trichogramma pretiosum]
MFKFTILFVVLVAGCLMLLNDIEAASIKTKNKSRGKSKTQNRFIYPKHGPNPPAPPRNAPNSYMRQKVDQFGTELANSVAREVGSQAVEAAADAIRSPSCSDGSCSGQPAADGQQPQVLPAQMMNSQQR